MIAFATSGGTEIHLGPWTKRVCSEDSAFRKTFSHFLDAILTWIKHIAKQWHKTDAN